MYIHLQYQNKAQRMNTQPTPAQTIAQQIGHRTFLMFGTQKRYQKNEGRTLQFNIRGARSLNWVEVTYDEGPDSYTVAVFCQRGMNYTERGRETGIYVEALHACLERLTGLYTRL